MSYPSNHKPNNGSNSNWQAELSQLRQRLVFQDAILKEQAKRLEEQANVIARLLETNQQLRDEIAMLKGQKPKPKIPSSSLEGPQSKDKEDAKKSGTRTKRGKHPRKKKKTILEIHDTKMIQPSSIPEDAAFKGYRTYTVQDIIFKSHNTQFRLARWQLPDGSYITGELPNGIEGHYGPELIVYILHQYYTCRVTEHLLLEQLHARGVLISAGQLNTILIKKKEIFHQDAESLLQAGIAAHNQVLADDTGARHKGKNQYTTVIGNEYFSVFSTTDSKSRVNFLKLLQNGVEEYLVNEDTVAYLQGVNVRGYLPRYIALNNGTHVVTDVEWKKWLTKRSIVQENEIRFVTEAALFASLIEKGIPHDLGVHGDDAGQFNVFVRSLCWIHEERHYRKLIMITDAGRRDLERVRGQIWEIYKELKAYKENPTITSKRTIEELFDTIFSQTTSSDILNSQLEKTRQKKEKLLRALERSNTPLHNNSSETDARAAKTKLKVSGGTRSDEGKEARDTFLSLQQTCYKLGINFLEYLKDRVCGSYKIGRLVEEILKRAKARSPVNPCESPQFTEPICNTT